MYHVHKYNKNETNLDNGFFSSFKHVLMGIKLCFGQYNNVLLAMNTPSIYLSFESELYPKGPPIVPKRPTEFIILI